MNTIILNDQIIKSLKTCFCCKIYTLFQTVNYTNSIYKKITLSIIFLSRYLYFLVEQNIEKLNRMITGHVVVNISLCLQEQHNEQGMKGLMLRRVIFQNFTVLSFIDSHLLPIASSSQHLSFTPSYISHTY